MEMFDNNNKKKKLLLIEDDDGDIALINELLKESRDYVIEIHTTQTLAAGIETVKKNAFDIVLLDLTLPDSQGLNTFLLFYENASIPIIVLSGLEDDELAYQAVCQGAQDYISKNNMDGRLLLRSIRYAIERYRLQAELEQTRYWQQQEQEIKSLARLSGSPKASVTAQIMNKVTLKNNFSQAFKELTTKYSDVMDMAVEQRIYKAQNNIGEQLQLIAEKLGFLKAGPRDVVEIHTTALKAKISHVNYAKAQIYVEEGRMTMLELMGNLLSYYRNYYISFRKSYK